MKALHRKGAPTDQIPAQVFFSKHPFFHQPFPDLMGRVRINVVAQRTRESSAGYHVLLLLPRIAVENGATFVGSQKSNSHHQVVFPVLLGWVFAKSPVMETLPREKRERDYFNALPSSLDCVMTMTKQKCIMGRMNNDLESPEFFPPYSYPGNFSCNSQSPNRLGPNILKSLFQGASVEPC